MANEPISIRVDSDVLKFIKKRASKERRTLSGYVNSVLADIRDKESKK